MRINLDRYFLPESLPNPRVIIGLTFHKQKSGNLLISEARGVDFSMNLMNIENTLKRSVVETKHHRMCIEIPLLPGDHDQTIILSTSQTLSFCNMRRYILLITIYFSYNSPYLI